VRLKRGALDFAQNSQLGTLRVDVDTANAMDLSKPNADNWRSFAIVLGTAIAVLGTTLVLMFSRLGKMPKNEAVSQPPKPSQTETVWPQTSSPAESTIYRLSCIPKDFGKTRVQALVKEALNLDEGAKITIGSLAKNPDPNISTLVATLSFSKDISHRLHKNEELRFPLKTKDEEVTLVLDKHFRGFTPLQKDSDCHIE
jgi:hypothetical protein